MKYFKPTKFTEGSLLSWRARTKILLLWEFCNCHFLFISFISNTLVYGVIVRSFFFCFVSVFFHHYLQKVLFPPIELPWYFRQKLIEHVCVGLILFCPFSLIYKLIWCYTIWSILALHYVLIFHNINIPVLFLFSKIVLTALGLHFYVNFGVLSFP